jgi:hypothetical protein
LKYKIIIIMGTDGNILGGTPLSLPDNKFNVNYRTVIDYDDKNTHILLYYS